MLFENLVSFEARESLQAHVQNGLRLQLGKAEGRNQFSFFRAEMNERVVERLSIENALRRALSKNEFSLVYQPIFHLPEKRIVGVEALLRWNSETLGAVSPARFIPVAEETGLIVAIGNWGRQGSDASIASLARSGARSFSGDDQCICRAVQNAPIG